MPYKRRTTGSEGSKQKQRKSSDEYGDTERESSSKNIKGKDSYC
jgi:hypothetical protein